MQTHVITDMLFITTDVPTHFEQITVLSNSTITDSEHTIKSATLPSL